MRKPFFKKSHASWYVYHHGKMIRLGTEKVAALQVWHELKSADTPATSSDSVASLLNLFLDWCQKNRSPLTYTWYKEFLSSFAKTIGVKLQLGGLKPMHVTQWIDKHSWNATTKHNAVRAVKRVFNWAIKEGRISRSPIQNVERPSPKRRESYLTPEQFELVCQRTGDGPFLDYVTFLFETGVRPQEIRVLEAKHVDADTSRIVLPASKSKGKQYPRMILLSNRAMAITSALAKQFPSGPIFRNTDGKPWTKDAVNCRFRRIRAKLSEAGTPIDGLCATSFRHGFATQALKNGVDPVSVSILMGHRDATQVAKTYQHLAADVQHLSAALAKVRGSGG